MVSIPGRAGFDESACVTLLVGGWTQICADSGKGEKDDHDDGLIWVTSENDLCPTMVYRKDTNSKAWKLAFRYWIAYGWMPYFRFKRPELEMCRAGIPQTPHSFQTIDAHQAVTKTIQRPHPNESMGVHHFIFFRPIFLAAKIFSWSFGFMRLSPERFILMSNFGLTVLAVYVSCASPPSECTRCWWSWRGTQRGRDSSFKVGL